MNDGESGAISESLLASGQLIAQVERLKQSLEQFIEKIPDVVVLFTSDGSILKANSSFIALFNSATASGESTAYPLGRAFTDIFQVHHKEIFFEKVSQLGEKKPVVEFELPVHRSGEVENAKSFHWICQSYLSSSTYGTVFAALGRDLTQLKTAERQISYLFQCIPLGIVTVHEDGKVGSTYSPYSEVLLGTQELEGKPFSRVLSEIVSDEVSPVEREAIESFDEVFKVGKSDYEAHVAQLPKLIKTRQRLGTVEEPFWLSLNYFPILVEERVVQLFIIIQNQTSWMKQQLEADRLREMTQIDELTQISNRRAFDERLNREVASFARGDCDVVSLIMIDVDYFKQYNDSYGHPEGDSCLKKVAKVLGSNLRRRTDLVCRYGGEEFVVILPHTDAAGAGHVAESLLEEIRGLALPHEHRKDSLKVVTASAGVATLTTLQPNGDSGADLVRRADQALYRAKSEGRNRACVDGEVEVPVNQKPESA